MHELMMKSLARIHWEKHRPKMVAHLKANKEYESALEHNARIAGDVLASKLRLGADLEIAEKYVLKTWIFLPDEKTSPLLDPDLMPFSQPGKDNTGLLPPKFAGKKGIAPERAINKHQ